MMWILRIIVAKPLYFVRSGYIIVNSGRLRDADRNGYDWSASTSSKHYSGSTTPSASSLLFSVVNLDSSNGPGSRWAGRPLRHYLIRPEVLSRTINGPIPIKA